MPIEWMENKRYARNQPVSVPLLTQNIACLLQETCNSGFCNGDEFTDLNKKSCSEFLPRFIQPTLLSDKTTYTPIPLG